MMAPNSGRACRASGRLAATRLLQVHATLAIALAALCSIGLASSSSLALRASREPVEMRYRPKFFMDTVVPCKKRAPEIRKLVDEATRASVHGNMPTTVERPTQTQVAPSPEIGKYVMDCRDVEDNEVRTLVEWLKVRYHNDPGVNFIPPAPEYSTLPQKILSEKQRLQFLGVIAPEPDGSSHVGDGKHPGATDSMNPVPPMVFRDVRDYFESSPYISTTVFPAPVRV